MQTCVKMHIAQHIIAELSWLRQHMGGVDGDKAMGTGAWLELSDMHG